MSVWKRAGEWRIEYIHCVDPVGSFSGRERSPFASDLGVLALVVASVCNNAGHGEREKENTEDAEEVGHLRAVTRS